MSSISDKFYDVGKVLFEFFDDLIYILNEDYICEFINLPIHEKRLGYNSLGKKFENFVHFQDFKKGNKFLFKLKETGIANEQLRIKDKKDYSYYDIKGKRFFDEASNPKYYLKLIDVSEFKAIETKLFNRLERLEDLAETLPEIRFWNLMQAKTTKKALQRTREMLGKVIDNIPQLLYWKDKELNYIGCNLNYALINELDSPQEIIGKKIDDLPWMRQFKSIVQEKERKTMKENKAQHLIESWDFPNSVRKHFEVNRIPLHNLEKEVIGILVCYNDITYRIQAEENLKKSERKYKDIIENVQEGYFEVNLKGDLKFFNETFREISGYS